jgi:hypothetical protein
MSFQDAFKSIGDGIGDLSELSVRTFTGTITANAANASIEKILGAGAAAANLKVVALTSMKIDGDIDQFISSDVDLKDSLLTAHSSAVQAAQRSRQAIVDMFSATVSKVVDDIN